MPTDAFSIKYTAKELNGIVKGAKVNKVNQPTPDEIVLFLYTTTGIRKLLISANAENCRVTFTEADKPNPANAFSFCMLLRKHLAQASIISVEIVDFERIIKITFDTKNDFSETEVKELYCEIMGKYSNVILTSNGIVLGCMKQSSLEVSNLRPLLTGMKYVTPPPQDKVDYRLKRESIDTISTFCGGDLGQFIFNRFKGLSDKTANEIAYIYYSNFGKNENVISSKLYDIIYDFIENSEIKPCIIENENYKDVFIKDYLSISGEKTYFDTVYSAYEQFYSNKEKSKLIDNKKRKLTAIVTKQEKKENKKLQIVLEKENSCCDMETNRIKGELITANLYRLKPDMTYCELENYYDENCTKMKIALDKNLTPNQNAQKYFKKYQKQKKTITAIIPQKQEILQELDYLLSVKEELENAKTIEEFDEIEEELTINGIEKLTTVSKKQKVQKSTFRLYNVSGFTVKVGKNNLQNQRLCDEAKSNDIWLHVKDFHSSHVIIESNGVAVPDKVIELSAEICVFYSKASGGSKIPVDYTFRKFVKKPPKSKAGFVNYTNYKTCIVDSNEHNELKI